MAFLAGSGTGSIFSYDDTDDKKNRKRSNLTLYTDYGTGCQYIRAGLFGPLTPRLDKDGKHVCVEKEGS